PEGQWFGVRVVDTENTHPAIGPQAHHITQRGPQVLPVRGPEIEWENIFVLLGRILGVLNRPVGPVVEPLGMLLNPRVVGRDLNGEVQRNLETVLASGGLKVQEVVEGAQLGRDRLVAAFRTADCVRAARIVWSRDQGVVWSLA